VLAKYKKRLGDNVGDYGGLLVDADRIPTGLFPFDLATGGGFPRGRCSIVYGPEDSCKTSLIFRAIAANQVIKPDEINVYVAIEPFDAVWAGKLGVNTSKLVVLSPSYAEEAVDMTGDFLSAEDCGIVAVDSLAAMITTQEAEKSAEGSNPGAQGLVTGKLVRKTTLALRDAEKAGRNPTLVYINQTRFKIGVMYGDPETMPGGNAPRYQAQLRVRTYGKAIKDSKVSDTYPVRREVNFIMKKHKVPIVADSGKFEMVTYPHNGLLIGETDDFNTISEYLKSFSALEKGEKGKGWVILGDDYPTLQAFKDRVYHDRKFGALVRASIIKRVLDDQEALIQPGPGGEVVDSDGVVVDEEP
jgi:recombination protein RecA